jgi:histidyl-tRNA synthetase
MIQTVRGMRDLFGPELAAWQLAEEVFRTVSTEFGYEEFRTPMLEHTELFKRGVGQDTDIVGKEMYSFEDRSGDNLTMRPEMTAPIVRAAIEHSLLRHSPVTRIWYAGPLFRHERPQKGRYRQFHQYGAECLGSPNPESDTEIILLANEILQRIGVQRYTLEINTLGSPEARTAYRAKLVDYLKSHAASLSADSLRRMETNPLRVLDSKDPGDRPIVDAAPRLVDHLDEASVAHFAGVRAILDAAGILYIVNPVMVRGLDYYSHTVFEFTTDALGSQNALCGGGRYDPLFALIGGTDAPAVGFSIGIDRVMLLLETERTEASKGPSPDVYLCAIGDAARLPVQLIALRLRRRGFSAVTDLLRRSVKGQMKDADRLRARWTATIGDDELANSTVVLKNMSTGEQQAMAQTDIERFLRDSDLRTPP